MKSPLAFCLIVLSLCLFATSVPLLKHLGGPPSEFATHRIPDPSKTTTLERSAVEHIWFKSRESDDSIFRTSFPVDSSQFELFLATPHSDKIILELFDASGEPVALPPSVKDVFHIGDGNITVPVERYLLTKTISGFYTLKIMPASSLTKQHLEELSKSKTPNAILSILNNDKLDIYTHFSNYIVRKGTQFGLVSQVIDGDQKMSQSLVHVTSANMGVHLPDGSSVDIAMHDDGLHDDGEAGDGIYGASTPLDETGGYFFQARLDGWFFGVTDDNTNVEIPFIRTTQHFVAVSDIDVELAGSASFVPSKENPKIGYIRIAVKNGDGKGAMRAYTELYTFNLDHYVPITWIGGIVSWFDQDTVELELHLDWLHGFTGPLYLQNTYLSDVNTHFPLTRWDDSIPLQNYQTAFSLVVGTAPKTPTEEMLFGVRPAKYQHPSRVAADAPTLLVLGGYCSDNPWPVGDFTNAAFFADSGSLGHDAYAQKALAFAESKGMQSFGMIGHSQGGMVALHIMNFYWSGMDLAKGERKIQSVGTPWLGCSAAGGAANLGQTFGVGCGENTDLTRDGAVNWLSGISVPNRNTTYYYTTTYGLSSWFGDWCSLPMNSVLEWPNDGTTEIDFAKLEGGVSMGNKEKWCHTTEMAYPSQTTDASRNREMDSSASR